MELKSNFDLHDMPMNGIQYRKFTKLVLPHVSFLQNYSHSLVRDPALAEDLIQETLLAAFLKLKQLRNPNKCRSWLAVILRNIFLSDIQKNKNRYFVNYEELENVLPDLSSQASGMILEGFSGPIQRHLERMDEKYKRPLIMKVIGEYSYKEIAHELNIPMGTVMSRIHRAKSFLRSGIESGFQRMESTLNRKRAYAKFVSSTREI